MPLCSSFGGGIWYGFVLTIYSTKRAPSNLSLFKTQSELKGMYEYFALEISYLFKHETILQICVSGISTWRFTHTEKVSIFLAKESEENVY